MPRWMLYLALVCPAWAMLTHSVLAADQILRIETGMHTAEISDAAMDQAGHLVVTTSYDKTARVWTLPELRPISVLRPPIGLNQVGELYSVAVTPDGTLAAVGGWLTDDQNSDAIDLFDIASGHLVRQFYSNSSTNSLSISSDGRLVAAGLYRGGVRVWQLADGVMKLKDPEYSGLVSGLDFAPDGRLAVSSQDGDVRLYDAALHLVKRQATEAGRRPRKIKFSPDGRYLAIGFDDEAAVEVRSAVDLSLLRRHDVGGSTSDLGRVAWSTDGREVLAGGSDQVFAWPRDSDWPRRVVASGLIDEISAILPLAGGSLVVANHPSLQVLTAGGQQAIQTSPAADLRPPTDGDDPSRLLFRISHDGTVVETDNLRNLGHPTHLDTTALTVTQLDVPTSGLASWQPTEESLETIGWFHGNHPQLNGRSLQLDPKETSRAIDTRRGRVLLGADWNLRLFNGDASMAWPRSVPTDTAWRVAQSPDGRLAVAALGDGTVRWYRASDGAELLAIFLHGDRTRWVAFTPSGYYAASPGGENLVGWEINNGPHEAADFFPASRFHDRFYRPDIVARVLRTLDEAEAAKQTDAAQNGALRQTGHERAN
jgi:WD40 repeat protein